MATGVPRGVGAAASSAAPEPDPARKGWTAGRIAALVAGSILILACVALLGGAGVLTWADQQQQGGYLATGTATYSTGGYALASDPVHLHGLWGWLGRFAGDVRIRVTATDSGTPVFAGIGPAGDVSRYLSGTSYTNVTALGDHDLTQHPGSVVPAPPAAALHWAAQVSGAGTQTLRWTVRSGDWTVVIMNADGSPGVAVRADVGLTSPVLPSFAGGCWPPASRPAWPGPRSSLHPPGWLPAGGNAMSWLLVVVAGIFETGFAVLLKQSHGGASGGGRERKARTVATGRQPVMSWAAMRLAVSAEMAKPTPMLPDCWPM